MSTTARVHILDGDLQGHGGHRFGAGKNKSEFPQNWSDNEIIQAIEDVANDQNSAEASLKPGRLMRGGARNRVLIIVVVEPGTGEVVTGYPKWKWW